ncbi:MAG: site-2 protease family protein [Eggerthellaceae bacterium]|nr:site-2 protease family protein [Eggerthellaceae bacterium]
MDTLLTILIGILVIGFLVFIHEGGHYLAARAFGVRVTEFMLGLPGPRIGFTAGETRFGVTAVPLGGYAKVCGMEVGEESPHLAAAMASMRARGTANMEDVAADLGISDDDAYAALEELTEWGTLTGPTRRDPYNTYRWAAKVSEGLTDAELFARERSRQYRALPFWKRSVILVAGPAMNILFAVLAFIICYSVVGFDMQLEDGTIVHRTLTAWQSIRVGFIYIGMVAQAVAQLFNPATVAEVISDSASVIGIAVISKQAADAGLATLLEFTAMSSVSLGVMNMLPIPPLDGGRFLVEIYQRVFRRDISIKAMNIISIVGVSLFLVLFVVMIGQDVSRFIFGNW